MPLAFEPSGSPAASTGNAAFIARTDQFWLELTDSGAILHFDEQTGGSHTLQLTLRGARKQPLLEAQERLPGVTNYLIGRDPSRWRTGVPQYARVQYHDVYPGIDAVYYGTRGHLEYDFLVQPGADPAKIQLQFRQAEQIQITPQGDLLLTIAGHQIRQPKPTLYQETAGRRVPVEGGYEWRSRSREIGFQIGPYDASRPLIIDPVLTYATFFGGNGDTFNGGIAVDAAGDLYLGGSTAATVVPGSSVASSASNINAFVTKLNPTGTAALYTTVYGGSGTDGASAIAVDTAGNAYVTGYTASPDFPTTALSWIPTSTNIDSYVLKLNPTGDRLLYSTYLTGHGLSTTFSGDSTSRTAGIAVNAQGVAYVAGVTRDPHFPVTAGAFQTSLGANVTSAGFVAALSADGSALVASTYLGGSNNAANTGLALDASGQPVVAGYTGSLTAVTSTDTFPTTPSAYQTKSAGNMEGYVTKLNANCTALVFSTFLGGSANDAARAVALDASGNVYVTGYTRSTNFPVTSNAYYSSGVGFVSKLDSSGAQLLYSTYLGQEILGPGQTAACQSSDVTYCESGLSIAVDPNSNFYVVGDAPNGYRVPTTPGSLFESYLDSGFDSFLVGFNAAGSLRYGTYWGANPYSTSANTTYLDLNQVAADAAGNIYFAGSSAHLALPTTPGALQTTSAPLAYTAFAGKLDNSATLCNDSLTAAPASFPAAGGAGILGVQFPAGCPWSLQTDSAVVTLTGPLSGTGPAQIPFTVSANGTGLPPRTALISSDGGLGASSVSLTQDGVACVFTLSPSSLSLMAAGSQGYVTVTASNPSCQWSAVTNTPWITLSSPASATGNSVFSFTVSASTTGQSRTGTISVGNSQVTVNQTNAPCAYSIGAGSINAPVSGGTFQIPIRTSTQDCTWNAGATGAVGFQVTSGSFGVGSGYIQLVIQPIAAGQSASGTLVAAGQSIPITQGFPDFSTLVLLADVSLYNSSAAFTLPAGTTTVQTRTIRVSNTQNSAALFSVSVTGTPRFLTVSPASNNTPTSVTLSANPAQLSPGVYTNTVVFTTTNGNSVSYPVTILIQSGTAGRTRVGIFRDSSGLNLSDANGDGTCCNGDVTGTMGQTGDLPLSGDWNGTGVKKFGLYRPSTGLFLLDVNNNGSFDGGTDKALTLAAQPGDIPVVGDWTGTGVDRAGVFRNGTWYLDLNGDGSFTGRAYLGQSGDVPLVGNWNGAGTKTKVGIYRPASVNGQPGNFFLVDTNGDGQYTSADQPLFFLGQNGDIPLVGDWSGDGATKVGIFRPSNGLFVLDQNGNFAWDGPGTDRVQYFQPNLIGPITTSIQSGDIPLTGDWAPSYAPAAAGFTIGQGRTRTGIFRPSTGTFFLDNTGDGTFQGRAFLGQSGDLPIGLPVIVNGTVQGVTVK